MKPIILRRLGKRGSITVETLVAFPLVLCILFTMMFFIAEGRLEMTMFNALSSGADMGASQYYTTLAIGEGVSGLGQVLSNNIFGGGSVSDFANGIIASNGQLKAIPHEVCSKVLRVKMEEQILADLKDEYSKGQWNVYSQLPNQSGHAEKTEDVYVEINQKSGISFGPFIHFEPLRITAYEKCWTGGSSDIRNWLQRSLPKEPGGNVFVTRTGDCYHLSSCTNSLDESCIPIAKDAAKIAGYRPCKLCAPGK